MSAAVKADWKSSYPRMGDELPIDINGVRVIGKVTCSLCPLQIEGDLGELGWFYFRARHYETRLTVGADLVDAVRANIDSDGWVAFWSHDDWDTRAQVIEAISDHLSHFFKFGRPM